MVFGGSTGCPCRGFVTRSSGFCPASTRHPLADLDLSTFAEEVFLEEDSYLVNAARHGQLALREILEPVLQRVEKDPQGRGAVRLFSLHPAGAAGLSANDRHRSTCRVLPARDCRNRHLSGVLHERWKAGESLSSLAEDYHRAPEEIEEAIRYEAA